MIRADRPCYLWFRWSGWALTSSAGSSHPVAETMWMLEWRRSISRSHALLPTVESKLGACSDSSCTDDLSQMNWQMYRDLDTRVGNLWVDRYPGGDADPLSLDLWGPGDHWFGPLTPSCESKERVVRIHSILHG